jgi:hypothetical protein
MVTALVVLVLSQNVESPPPLVEADTVLEAPNDLDSGPTAMRFAATFGGALVGLAPTVGLIAAMSKLCNTFDGTCQTTLVLGAVAIAPLLMGFGAWLGHHLAGGQGTYGKAVAGAAMGLGTGLAVMFVELMADKNPKPGTIGTAVGIASACAFGITAAMLEYSHRNEREVAFAVVPVNGGAMASLGGRF